MSGGVQVVLRNDFADADATATVHAAHHNALASASNAAAIGWTYASGAGIDPTGAADSTTAIQAKIDAAPWGGTVQLPVGIFKISSITVSGGRRLIGAGYSLLRDSFNAFGDSNFLSGTPFAGTIIRSTATSGAAITVLETGFTPRGDLNSFVLIGPGSGSSIGVSAGDTTHSIVGAEWPDVYVCNFATGVYMRNVEDSRFGLKIRGCTTGLSLAASTNNNVFSLADAQHCVTGIIDDGTCLSNVFVNPLLQGNTGTSITLNGVNEQIIGGYWENAAGTRAIDFATGLSNSVSGPRLATANDGIRVLSPAVGTKIDNPTGIGPIANAGNGTFIVGDLTTGIVLTDTASNTITLNAHGSQMRLPPTTSPLSTQAVASGGQAILAWGDVSSAVAWQLYKINGSDELILRDMTNSRSLVTYYPGASASTSLVAVSSVLGLAASATGSRPNAGNYAAGTMWYDSTLHKVIVGNGSVWLDTLGTAV